MTVTHHRLTDEERHKEAKREGVVRQSPWGVPLDDGRPREPTTYHQIGTVEAQPVGGRFAAETKSEVIGASPSMPYPAQPPGSPWSGDPVPDEPPLGFDINDQMPVGEPGEIEASICQRNAQSSYNSDDGLDLPQIEAAVEALRAEGHTTFTPKAITAKLGRPPKSLAEMTDDQLEYCAAKADLEMRQRVDGAEIDELQAVKDSALAELERRRKS